MRSSAPRGPLRKFLDFCLAGAILVLLAVVAARLDRAGTTQLGGQPVINDGDSITLGAERIRLRGIDAPEYNQLCQKQGADYACGRRSRDELVRFIAGRPVSCSGWERDRYGRLLAVCTVAGVELNRLQVERGWAVAYGDYEDAEALARRNGVGLWAGNFERPGDWRKIHGGAAESLHDIGGAVLNWLREILRFS